MKKVFVAGLMMFSLVSVSIPPIAAAQTPRAGLSDASVANCSTLKDSGLNGVVNCFVDIFNIAIYLMLSAAVVYIIYGAFTMITSEEKREEAKKTIYYGIIGLFVMISIWGFVNILDKTFNLSGGSTTKVLNQTFIK